MPEVMQFDSGPVHQQPTSDVTQTELVYDGNEVKDGTIPIEYMIDALTGFANAYEKTSGRVQGPDAGHRLRVAGLQQNSTHILINVIEWVKQNPAAAGVLLTGATAAAAGAYKVVAAIGKVITATKHLAGAPVEPAIQFIGPNIFVINEKKEKLELSKEELELLRSQILAPDIDKMTKPLDNEQVTDFEINVNKKPITRVTKDERPYFVHMERNVTTSRDDVWMEGTLNSLTKDRNRGMFHTVSGKHIPYRYVGNDQQQLLRGFAYNGTVRAKSRVTFDADLNPTSLDIDAIQPGQPKLFSSEGET